MNLTGKTLKNSAYNLTAFLWPIGLAFFITPYVVHHLGQDLYGILALVESFIGFFAILDFGVAPSLVRYTSALNAENDSTGISRIFSAAFMFYVMVGLAGGLLIVLGAWLFTPVMLKSQPELIPVARLVFNLSALGFLINMVLSAFAAIPGALQRFDITSRVNIVASTLASFSSVIILYRGHGVIAIVAAGMIINFAALFIYGWVNRRLIPKLKFTMRPDKDSIKKIFSFSGYAFVATLSGVVIAQLDRLILGGMQGPAAVTYYVVPGDISIKIHGFVVAATAVVFPLTADLLTKRQDDRLLNLYRRATRLILSVLVLGVTPMLLFAHPFLLQWLGPEFASKSTVVFQLLLITYFFSSLHVIPFLIAYGAGKPVYSAAYSLAVAVLNILMMFVLIPRYGINGAGVAYLIAVLPTTLFFIWFVEKRILSVNLKNFYTSLLARLLLLFGMSFLISWKLSAYITSLKLFLAMYVVTVVVSFGLFAAFGMIHPEDLALLLRTDRDTN